MTGSKEIRLSEWNSENRLRLKGGGELLKREKQIAPNFLEKPRIGFRINSETREATPRIRCAIRERQYGPGNKKTGDQGMVTGFLLSKRYNRFWWRRGGSNPRPQVLYRQFYILSLII